MLTSQNIYVILFSLPVYQLLYFTAQLLTFRKSANRSRKYLGFLMFLMTLFLVINAVYKLDYIRTFSFLYIIFIPLLLSIIPTFYIYLCALVREDGKISIAHKAVLFSGPILSLVLLAITYGLFTGQEKLSFITSGYSATAQDGKLFVYNELVFWLTAIGLVLFQLVYFIIKITQILVSEEKAIENRPAHLPYLQINWLIAMSVSIMLFVFVNAIFLGFVQNQYIIPALVFNVIMFVSGAVAGVYGMKQENLFDQVVKLGSRKEQTSSRLSPDEPLSGTISKTSAAEGFLSEKETGELIGSLKALMEKDKPYLNNRLNMVDLCDMLRINRRKLSYIINVVMDKNFYAFVNEYRIKEAEELLRMNQNESIKLEAIAGMAGFQSKSSFNACFKKYTGRTPSEFRNNKRGSDGKMSRQS
jgi:AraC-like DNA-binding protein